MNFGKNSKNVRSPQIYFEQCYGIFLVGVATDARIKSCFKIRVAETSFP